jgi:hypothetical protein
MLRSAMRLPHGLRREPHRHQDEETRDRTEHSEHKAIVCMLANRIHVLFLVAPNLAQRLDQTTELAN